MKKISFIIFFLSISSVFANQKVRRVAVQGDQIVTVRTSLGIATIIQVPDRPNSIVIGDQDAFKVEYLDQAITIKPLSTRAKSNLYIYTDWKRYNVELVTGNELSSDYVVYLENQKSVFKPTNTIGIKWTNFKNHLKNDELVLTVNRVGKTKDGILLVEFLVSSSKLGKFKPDSIWLTQSGLMKPIHNLILSSLEFQSQKAISGVLQIKESDLNLNEPMRLEMRRNKVSYLTIQKVSAWK